MPKWPQKNSDWKGPDRGLPERLGKGMSPREIPFGISAASKCLPLEGRSAMFECVQTLSYQNPAGFSASIIETTSARANMEPDRLPPLIRVALAASLSTKAIAGLFKKRSADEQGRTSKAPLG